MIIAINTRLLLKNKLEGIGRFTFEILKRVTTKHKEHTFIFFFDRKYDESFIFSENVIPVVLFPQSRHPFLWYWYFEFSVTKALKKYKADVFVTTDGWLSTITEVKTLQVLHDLHYENYPEFLPLLTRKYYQFFFPKFVKKANRIITVSNFCKNEIIKTYKINENKIDVVYNSTRNEYFQLSENEILKIKNEYSNGNDYFLFIGPIHPRKNLDNVIKAFFQFKQNSNENIKLIVTGSNMWRNFGQTSNFQNDEYFKEIIFTGFVDTTELFKITAAANCLLYVSFYEGFGMPILEAMSCNVPVITSNCASMPEVAGDAAILVNPKSVEEIKNAMFEIQSNNILKQSLISNSKQNLERFSWDNSAEIFWNCILKTKSDD